MFDYEMLRVIWWLLLGILLIGFAETDGFDLGLGAVFRFLGRTEPERRALIETIEPVWDGNQVWLILGAGAVFAAWPTLYAASFSALYPAMLLLLFALILRPVGFGFRNRLSDARWRNAWDWALCMGGAVPALLFGIAFGDLFGGIPFHFDSLQRIIYGGGFFNLLTPFAIVCAFVSLSMMILHGAAYASMKAGEPMSRRACLTGMAAACVFVLSFALAGLMVTFWMNGYRIMGDIDPGGPSNPILKTVYRAPGAWIDNYRKWPWMWLAPLIAFGGAALACWMLALRRAGNAFMASCLVPAGTILTAGFALFPFLLPSSENPSHSLTVWDASSSALTLRIMFWSVVVFLPVVLGYTAWVFRVLRGRITLEKLREHA
jgi:cytochrome bd ubiquinol oxidase subunit II